LSDPNYGMKKYKSQPSGPLWIVFHLAIASLLHHFFAFASEAGPDSPVSSSDQESSIKYFEIILAI